tara:strand:+ start:4211 stop:5071 length:861 start_codon:yes stop_codon:yes gene_type:complete
MNILIIGSEGSIGKSIKNHFLKKKNVNKIICIDKVQNQKKIAKIYYKKLDLSQNIQSKIIFKKKIDIVFFLSFNLNFKKVEKKKYIEEGKNILKNGLKIIKQNKIKKIIYFSSFAVYGKKEGIIKESDVTRPFTVYGKLKKYSENKIISNSSNYKYLILRISQIYGSQIKTNIIYKFILNTKSGKKIYLYGSGKQKRDFLSIKDFLALLDKLYNFKTSGIYNVCGNSSFSIMQILNILNYKFKIKTINNEDFNLVGDNTKLKKKFKWKPSINFKKEIIRMKKLVKI